MEEDAYKECFCTWQNTPWDALPRYMDSALGRAVKTTVLKYSASELPSHSVVPTLLCNSGLLMVQSEKLAINPSRPAHSCFCSQRNHRSKESAANPVPVNLACFWILPHGDSSGSSILHLRLLLSSTEQSLLEVLLCYVELKHWFQQRDFLDVLADIFLHLNCIRKVLFPGNKVVFEIIHFSTYMATTWNPWKLAKASM